MTTQPSNSANSGNREFPFTQAPNVTMETEHNSPEAIKGTLGGRLRAAREARGLDVETCAHALRLPTRVLRQVESNEYSGIDHVYLGGYLIKYARYLGVDEAEVRLELDRIKPAEPTLVATGGISHSRYLLENYARAATYVVLTAAIVVPTIWLGVRGTLDRDVSHLAPLDAAPVAQVDAPASSASAAASTVASTAPNTQEGTTAPAATPAPAAAPAQDQPLMASMTPFLGDTHAAAQPAAPTPTTDAGSVGGGAHSLVLSLQNASWVEVTGKDGSRLEYGLLPAGSSKTYRSDQPLEVRIGNAGGAQVMLDGQPMPLDSYRRSNVAHFRIELRDGKATPAGA